MRIALVVALSFLASLCLASRCNADRWANPVTGIPPHPGGTPEIGYIEAAEPIEPDAGEADADAAPQIDASEPDTEQPEGSTTSANPY